MALKDRIAAARRAYRAKPTNTRLRALLWLKAKAQRYDPRMCLHYGVDPKVNEGCRRAICRAYAAGLVPTSTTGGAHATGSWHFRKSPSNEGCGVDIGVRREDGPGTERAMRRLEAFQLREIARFRLGKMPGDLVELIGPANLHVVLKDQEADLVEGSDLEQAHDNHVHLAFRS
jgi:hypothetical protein